MRNMASRSVSTPSLGACVNWCLENREANARDDCGATESVRSGGGPSSSRAEGGGGSCKTVSVEGGGETPSTTHKL